MTILKETINHHNQERYQTGIRMDLNTLEIPESLFAKLNINQKKLVQTLAANHPEGLLSSELTQEISISNKSDLVHHKLRMLLATYGLEIHTQRVSRQWLWKLRPIETQPREVAQ